MAYRYPIRIICLISLIYLLQSLHSPSYSNSNNSFYDYIIFGGGLSGLHAASLLIEHNITSFRVFEAQDHFGGKVIGDNLKDIKEVTSQQWWNQDSMGKQYVKIGGVQIDHFEILIQEVIKDLDLQLDVEKGTQSDIFVHYGNRFIEDHFNQSEKYKQFDHKKQYGEEIRRVYYTIKNDSQIYGQAMDRAKINLTQEDAQILIHYSKLSFKDYIQSLNIKFEIIKSMLYSRFDHMNSLTSQKSSIEVVMKTMYQTGDVWVIGEDYGIINSDSSEAYEVNGNPYDLIQTIVNNINKKNKDYLKLNHEVIQIDNSNYEQQKFKVMVKVNGQIKTFTTKHVISAIPLAVLASLNVTKMSQAKRYILRNLQAARYLKANIAFKEQVTPLMKRPIYSKNISTISHMGAEYLSNYCYDPFESLGGMTYYIHQRFFDKYMAKSKEQKMDYCRKLTIEIDNLDYDNEIVKRNLENIVYFESETIHDNRFLKSIWGQTQKVGTFAHVVEHFKQSPHKVLERDEFGVIYIGADHSALHCTQMDGAVIVARAKIHKLLNKTDKYRHLYEKYYPS